MLPIKPLCMRDFEYLCCVTLVDLLCNCRIAEHADLYYYEIRFHKKSIDISHTTGILMQNNVDNF